MRFATPPKPWNFLSQPQTVDQICHSSQALKFPVSAPNLLSYLPLLPSPEISCLSPKRSIIFATPLKTWNSVSAPNVLPDLPLLSDPELPCLSPKRSVRFATPLWPWTFLSQPLPLPPLVLNIPLTPQLISQIGDSSLVIKFTVSTPEGRSAFPPIYLSKRASSSAGSVTPLSPFCRKTSAHHSSRCTQQYVLKSVCVASIDYSTRTLTWEARHRLMQVLRSTQAQETRETYVQAGTTTPGVIYLCIYLCIWSQ
jgi:hypothetical protein